MCVLGSVGIVGAILPNALAESKNEKPGAEAAAKITQALKAVYPDAVIGEMGKETEDGISFYEVGLTVKGTKMDADVTSDGTIIETEQEADMQTFPKAAADAIKKAAKGMKISGGELTTTYAKAVKDDTTGDIQTIRVVKLTAPTISYEVDVKKDGREGEIAASAEGTILESPKWAKTGKDKEEDKD